MQTCRQSSVMLLELIYVALFTAVSEPQGVKYWPDVTGFLGQDVTLPCHFIQEPNGTNIVQVQWDLRPPEGKEMVILVWHFTFGPNASETFLKERVKVSEEALIVRAAELRDAGLYICRVTTFPSGSFIGFTNLVVREQMPLSSGELSAILISVLILLGILAATVYFIRRRDRTVRHRVYIDTGGPVMDVFRPSVIVRDEDVVYSDVKLRPSREASPPSKDKHRPDDVTYSEVLVLSQTSVMI